MAYFTTWSAVNTAMKETGQSLVEDWLKPEMEQLALPKIIECQWPISLITARCR